MRKIRTPNTSLAIVAAALALILLFAAAATAQTYEAATAVNLRKGPGSEEEIIRALKQGEQVEKIGASGGYIHVRTDQGEEGYVWGTYLKRIGKKERRVPGFDEFGEGISGGPELQINGPGRYYVENVLEFLRIENHPVYVILLPLLVAIGLGVGGGVFISWLWPRLDGLLPSELTGRRRQAARIAFTATEIYILAKGVFYFTDLSLNCALLEEDTALVVVLAAPRLVLAGPVTVIDFLATNWVVGLSALLLILIILWPGFSGKADRNLAYMDTIPQYTPSRGEAPAPEEDTAEQHTVEEEEDEE